ncbi:hypothetical protein phytr_10270 [Candidatus Phycorickettsia trachydisci]|uniref:AAA+ ATPase domain-containing protein n=1 Tax=Candidatus Phycorickettsia trachydisci TaxID=2115978 RepID=A0A2P1P9N4_9RICK|nr:MobA/MobL family protein [Candidatus Phycorickettsia trachydisci]AVP87955.1 hypothetical protein phytr_10270 [Candidatus Phycorickettsia trachydisci]
MAIYHFSTNPIQRSKGESAVGAAAYRAGVKLVQKIVDPATGAVREKIHNYENKKGVVHKEILVPEGFVKAEWLKDRQELWQRTEDSEIRKDAQLGRQIVIALPKELSEEENIELAVNFAKEVLAKDGMVVDVAVHYDNPDNPHAHLLMTMRDLEFDKEGEVVFGGKNRDWNSKQKIFEWRKAWEKCLNKELSIKGFDMEVSAASFKDRGIDLVATKHEGKIRHIARVMRVQAYNEQVRLANLEVIRENPEMLIDMLQSRKGVFNRDDIVKGFKGVLFESCGGRLTISEEEELVRGVEGIMNSEKLVRVSDRGFGGKAMYAGKRQVEKEAELVRAANELKSRYGHMIAVPEGGKIDEGLSVQQEFVVKGVLESSDLAIVQGLPGAGKSTIAKTIAKEYEKLGYRVLGTAVTAAACKNLHEITDMQVQTIAHMKTRWDWLEKDGKAIDFGSRDVLIIDEMSMVSLSDMGYLLSKAAEKGAKVIALGDVNQFAAIKEHGAASKLIEIADVFELNQVKRMKNPQHSKAAEMMADKKIEEAIEVLSQQGVFKLSSSRVVARENLVLDYVSKYAELVEDGEGKYLGLNKKMVILAHTNKEVNALNKMIRSELKSLEVLDAQDKQVKVGSRRMSFAVGEQVVFGKNDKDLGVINGDVGVINGIKEFDEYSGGRYADVKVKLSTGKLVTINTKEYKDISYGYAITAYKGQGGTYEYVYVVHEKGLRYEAFNVMITRHEKGLIVYVNEEDLKIKSVLQDAKFVELVKKLASTLSLDSTSGLVIDHDFESVEAKNIQHYLGIKAEVKEEVELFNKWKKTQIAEKGFVPKSSAYDNMDSFTHKVALRKAAASMILADFDKHNRLLKVAGVSKGLLEVHAGNKEKNLDVKHFRLVSSNWKESALDLTQKWLEHQDDLIDKLAAKETELHSLQVEHEAEELKLRYLNHYISSHMSYLQRVYKDAYHKIHDQWDELQKKYGAKRLVQMVNKNPQLLGEFRGKFGWYGSDEERKEAKRLAVNIGDSMRLASDNQDSCIAHNDLMDKKGLGTKIEKLSLEVSNMEKLLASKKDYKFMNSLKISPEILERKADLGKWQSLLLGSGIVDDNALSGLVEEVKFKQANTLYKNIWRYKSVQNGLNDLVLRIADWYSKESLEYPSTHLFFEYKRELKDLWVDITSKEGWQGVVKARGLFEGCLKGDLTEERDRIVNRLSKGVSKENIARLADIYLNERVKICEKFIEHKSSYFNLKKELNDKEQQIKILQGKKQGELGNLNNIYQEGANEILSEFKKLQKVEGDKAIDMVNHDPEVLGTYRGFGIGKIIRTMDRVRAHELSQGVASSISSIFKLESEIEALKTEISKGGYQAKIKDLDHKAFVMQIHDLSTKTLQNLQKLKNKQIDRDSLETLECIARQKIADKDRLLGIENRFEIKQEVLKFDDVVKQLRSSDYERLFRQYAGNIVDGKENIRVHGSSISYGSLNMNLDNGLWIRFSTGESGNIFHFVQKGAGVDKVHSLQIVADQVGCAGLNATFIKKAELHPVEPEVKQEQRLVPITFNEELTKEAFEERFGYLCSANKLEALHRYCDDQGNILGYAARLIDRQSGKKQVLPVAYLYDQEENKAKVALKAFTDQKLVYGLEKLRDNKTVLIVEGEKTADIAQTLFPEMNVISWIGGSNSAYKVDWSGVHGKQVVIWPDNDAPGVKAAEIIHERLSVLENYSGDKVSIVDVKNLGLPEKWDLADKLPEHLSKENIKELVSIHDKDYCVKQIKEQAKEISLELEHKLEKLLDPRDELKALRKELQQFKHPRLNKDIIRDIATEHVFEATLKNNNMPLSEEQKVEIYQRLAHDIKDIAYEYEALSYEQIANDPDSFKRFYSKKGPNNKLLLQEIRQKIEYETRVREMGSDPRDRNMEKDFGKMLEQAHENHFVKEISKENKDIGQSVAEQIADYGLKHGMSSLTTKRLEIMHDIAKEEHQHLDKAISHGLDHHKELDIEHDHFKEMNRNLGRAFRDHMLHDHLHNDHNHHDHHIDHNHHQEEIANRLAHEALMHHLEEQHRIQHELTVTHTLKLHH